MRRWELGSLARAAEAEITGGVLPESVGAVGTDSRSLPPDCLFVALRGERFDGHAFVGAAINAGARAVVVDRAGHEKLGKLAVPALVVQDTQRALGDMAAAARRSLRQPVVAVTGSNGKTTTKEMIASILAERGPVHRTSGNLNNLIGLPLTVFAWPTEAWAAVLEMGMNVPGEIARLTDIAAPDVGVITMVAAAHLEGLGSLEAVGRAKGELFAHLGEGATAIVNADDEMVQQVAVPLLGARPRLSFGTARHADVRILAHAPRGTGVDLSLSIREVKVSVRLPLAGAHNARNAAAAAAAASALGLTPAQIAVGLEKVRVPGGRLRVIQKTPRGVRVLDDSYNANPASMKAAFATLADLAQGGRRFAVLGDMFELGPTAPALHREVGEAAAASGVTRVLALGPHSAEVARGAVAAGGAAQSFDDLDSLLRDLDAELRSGDWVLVKGSHGMKMERVVQHLEGGR